MAATFKHLRYDHHEELLQALQTPSTLALKEPDRTSVWTSVALIIGTQHTSWLQRAPKQVAAQISCISRALFELQDRFKAGLAQYNEWNFPVTKELIRQYIPRMSPGSFFANFAPRIYELPTFPEECYEWLSHDPEKVARVVRIRSIANTIFWQIFETEEEEKADGISEEAEKNRSLAFAKFVLNSGLYYPNKGEPAIITPRILFDAWVSHDRGSRDPVRQRAFSIAKIEPPNLTENIIAPVLMQHASKPFPEFAVEAILQSFVSHLAIVPMEQTQRVIKSWSKSSFFRTVMYYIHFPEMFLKIDFSARFQGDDLLNITRIQQYFLLLHHEGVAIGKRAQLLEMLLCSDRENFAYEKHYLQKKFRGEDEERKTFTRCWDCVVQLAQHCQCDKPFEDKHIWQLLYHFLTQPIAESKAQHCVGLFKTLAEKYQYHPSISYVLKFCEINANITEASSALVLSAVEEVHKSFRGVDGLKAPTVAVEMFFEPPMDIHKFHAKLAWMHKRVGKFLVLGQLLKLELEPACLDCCKVYLYSNFEIPGLIVSHYPKLGIREVHWITLQKYLETTTTEFTKPPKDQEVAQALRVVRELDKEFPLVDLHKLRLLRDAIFLIAKGRAGVLREVVDVIFSMRKVCGGLTGEMVCHIFQYPHDRFLKKWGEILELWEGYVAKDHTSIALDPKIYWQISDSIEDFAEKLFVDLDAIKTEKLKNDFIALFRGAFFPSFGYLRAFLNISGFCPDGRGKWAHIDQAKLTGVCEPMSPSRETRLHLEWQTVRRVPHFYFSVLNQLTGEMRSHSVPFLINLETLQEENVRAACFGFFTRLSVHILTEEIRRDFCDSWDPKKKTITSLLPYYVGAKEELDQASDNPIIPKYFIKSTLKFFSEVLVTFRQVYLDRMPLPYEKSALEVAAQGFVYHRNNQWSLLPTPWQLTELESQGYSFDLSPEDIHQLTEKFLHGPEKPTDTEKGLWISDPDQNDLVRIPIYYSAMNLKGLKRIFSKEPAESEKGAGREEEKSPELTKLYVTLSTEYKGVSAQVTLAYDSSEYEHRAIVDNRCSSHVMLLKARVYQILSSKEIKPEEV